MIYDGWLDFEQPIVKLERRIEDLRQFAREDKVELTEELRRLERKTQRLTHEIYSRLTPWQRVQLARHPRRPYTLDYIHRIFTGFTELHGDRLFGDDRAIIGGMAWLDGKPVVVIGHQKGRNTKENLERNFGMAHPEGYRKALRLMDLAARFGRPIVTFIDTPGAYPGVQAEERGQSVAIARNLFEMARFPVPFVAIVIGEGGSGGALALGVADSVLMMENSVYSVISPEGCAAILWQDRSKTETAATALRMTAQDLLEFGLIDGIVKEPMGGAHRDPAFAAEQLKGALSAQFERLAPVPPRILVERRIEKFVRMGVFEQPYRPEADV
jgi:acetyl-CoA carboxylase carboxyl transferase subunit alpha